MKIMKSTICYQYSHTPWKKVNETTEVSKQIQWNATKYWKMNRGWYWFLAIWMFNIITPSVFAIYSMLCNEEILSQKSRRRETAAILCTKDVILCEKGGTLLKLACVKSEFETIMDACQVANEYHFHFFHTCTLCSFVVLWNRKIKFEKAFSIDSWIQSTHWNSY
jgi:hypothetical protein